MILNPKNDTRSYRQVPNFIKRNAVAFLMAFDDRLTALKRGIIHLAGMAVHHKRQPPRTLKRQKKGLSSWWEESTITHWMMLIQFLACFQILKLNWKKSPREGRTAVQWHICDWILIHFPISAKRRSRRGRKTPGPRNECNTERGEHTSYQLRFY